MGRAPFVFVLPLAAAIFIAVCGVSYIHACLKYGAPVSRLEMIEGPHGVSGSYWTALGSKAWGITAYTASLRNETGPIASSERRRAEGGMAPPTWSMVSQPVVTPPTDGVDSRSVFTYVNRPTPSSGWVRTAGTPRMYRGFEVATGWPFRAFLARDHLRVLASTNDLYEGPLAMLKNPRSPTWNIRLFHDPMFPPRIILWRGFLLDLLFYFVLVGAWPFYRRTIRPSIRRARGRCPSCGYSRSGLASDALCPECGKPASFTTANSFPSPLPPSGHACRPASVPAVSAGTARRP